MYAWTCILVEGSRSGTNHVFHKDHQSKNELHINFLAFQFHNLNGAVAYHPRQRWAYYSFQNTKEVAIFVFVIYHLCHHFCSLSWIIFSSLFFVSGQLSIHQVLLFHHFTRDKFFVNPHTSFQNPNCPKDHGSRVSVEIRVALYFWHIYILNHFVFLTSIHIYCQQFRIWTHLYLWHDLFLIGSSELFPVSTLKTQPSLIFSNV